MFKFILHQVYQNKLIIKFGISGATAAAVDFSLLYYLHGIKHIELKVSVTIAFIAAFFVSFYLQKFWTFRDGENKRTKKQMILFFGVGIFNTCINYFSVPYLTSLGLFYIFSQAVSAVILSIGSFVMYRYVIFAKTHKNLKKKHLFSPDAFNGLRVLIAVNYYSEKVEIMRHSFKNYGNRVKILAFDNDIKDIESFYAISNKGGMVVRAFEYFYHLYKIANWSDVVYLFANQKTVVVSYFACLLKRRMFILEVDKQFICGVFSSTRKNNVFLKNIEERIINKSRIIVIRDESLIPEIEKLINDKNKIVVLFENETIDVAKYLI